MNKIQKNKIYNFRSEGGIATIDIFADIDPFFGYDANQIKEDLNNFSGYKILVNINSAGGSVTEGIAIANILKADPRHVTTRAVGVAASIASVILMSGNTVQMSKNSFVMIHNVWADTGVQTWGEADDLRKAADELNSHAETLEMMSKEIVSFYLDTIKKRGKYIDGDRQKTRKEIERIMSSQNWINSKTAKKLGLIDEIKDFESSAPDKIQAQIYNQIKNQKIKIPFNMEKINPKNGASLAAALQEKIDQILSEDEETTMSEVVASMAEAAEISADTVNQILRGEVNCPPVERLEGFAEALKMSVEDIISAAEADGCMYGEEEEEEEEEEEIAEDKNQSEECEECQKEEVQNSESLLSKMKAGINALLGRNKEPKAEPSNKLEELRKEIDSIQNRNKILKEELSKSKKNEVDALNFLKDTQKELSKINQIRNRSGQKFENFNDLISEYKALIEHNKEVGGLPVSAGTPVSENELTAPVEKSTFANSKEDLHSKFDRMKREAEAKTKSKKTKK